MASSVWSGYLTFGLISMPVRLFSGARGNHISFHMLHRDDNTRIKQQLWCPHDERVVERSEIVKGFEYRKGEYVIIEPEEIKKIEPKTAKAMEILEFKSRAPTSIPSTSSRRTSWCRKTRASVPTPCCRKRWRRPITSPSPSFTMHNREYTVFLRPYKGGMMLHTMYYKNEVKDLDNFGAPDVELKDAEVKVAHQLIEALAAEWEPEKYHDTFEENLKTLIKARLEGEEVTPVEKPKKMAPVVDLMAALKEESGADAERNHRNASRCCTACFRGKGGREEKPRLHAASPAA